METFDNIHHKILGGFRQDRITIIYILIYIYIYWFFIISYPLITMCFLETNNTLTECVFSGECHKLCMNIFFGVVSA